MTVSFADDLNAQLGPWQTPSLTIFADALAVMFQPVADLIYDQGEDGDEDFLCGWGILLDVDACKPEHLPYLGQFVGVQVTPGLNPEGQRIQIREAAAHARGTVAAMVGAAKPYLSGTRSATMYERTDGVLPGDQPYLMLLITYTAETAVSPTIGLLESTFATAGDIEAAFTTIGQMETQLSPTEAEMLAAVDTMRPAGVYLTHRVDDGWSLDQFETAYTGLTIAGPEADYATIGALETHLP